tara:strand:+ start:93 stop:551 length:459 start_codon:yes stop_codon:yes gene_type:complete
MIIISHRGNLKGPNLERENHPDYIDAAIVRGFDVEIDVWVISNINWTDKIFLGHDGPEYEVSKDWLMNRKDKLWVHCKNLKAASLLSDDLRCFGSEHDPFCYMSQGHIWVNNVDVKPVPNCVVPLLGLEDIKAYRFMDSAFAICTDYPEELA